MELLPILYRTIVQNALLEDLGRAGDLTTDSIVPRDSMARGKVLARSAGCIAGLGVAEESFRALGRPLTWKPCVGDGDVVSAGALLASIEGPARVLLTGERTALNFLGQLSGIATETRAIVSRLKGHKARVVCTRKTSPGLRILEKYAVRAGGGSNHRFGLDDAVLIKDNHLVVAGSIPEAVRRVRERMGHMIKIELEVDSWSQLEEALQQPIDAVLLDNMSPDEVTQAVDLIAGRLLVEVSGGITPDRAVEYAKAGVDLISIGWLTHSAPALDVSLDVELA